MRTAIALGLCMVVAMSWAGAAVAQSDQEMDARLEFLFGEHEPYRAFLEALHDAVAAQDKKAVAAMIAYPFETTIAGTPIGLEAAEDFVRQYDRLFTPAVVAALDRQTYAMLFATADGVMIGDGEIWFSGICTDQTCSEASIKIIAVNPATGEVDQTGQRSGAEP